MVVASSRNHCEPESVESLAMQAVQIGQAACWWHRLRACVRIHRDIGDRLRQSISHLHIESLNTIGQQSAHRLEAYATFLMAKRCYYEVLGVARDESDRGIAKAIVSWL